ncbi:MAG: aromatic ring-hydroxylating dioxygenase subunit alpha [Pseudomonadota bacterium]
MKNSLGLRLLDELLNLLDEGKDADAGRIVKNPTQSYTDEQRATREWQLFFREYPQLIGLSGDIPNPGDYIINNDLGVSVIALRDKQKKFRVFLNACRHRGAQLCEKERGKRNSFSCPFHGWTYDSSGRLIGVPEDQNFGLADRASFGLVELPSEERYGLLWMHPQREGALSVEDILGPLAEDFESWDLSQHMHAGENIIKKNMNWKLANDTFGENYHFKRLHKNTLNNIAIGDAHVFETFGRNSRLVFASRGIHKLKDKPRARWRIDAATTILYFLFPNIQMTVSNRQVAMFRIYPDGPTAQRSVIKVGHYFSAEALDLIDNSSKTVIGDHNVYDATARDGNAIVSPEATMEVINSTAENEDFKMAEMAHRSAESGLLDQIIFGRNEPALHHFHNTYNEALGLAPLEELH